jgi:hypothetical protein
MVSHGWREFRKNSYSIVVADDVCGVADFVYAMWPEVRYITLRVWIGLVFDTVERQVMHLMGRRYRKYQSYTMVTHLDFLDPARKNYGWTFYEGRDITQEYGNLITAIDNIALVFMHSHGTLESLSRLFTIPPEVFWHIGYEGDHRAPVVLWMLGRTDEALEYMERVLEYGRTHKDPSVPDTANRPLVEYEAYTKKVREMILQGKGSAGNNESGISDNLTAPNQVE